MLVASLMREKIISVLKTYTLIHKSINLEIFQLLHDT